MKTIQSTLGVLSALAALLMIPQEGSTAGLSQMEMRAYPGAMKLADSSAKVSLDRSDLACVETRCFELRGQPICYCDRIADETEDSETSDPVDDSDDAFACPTMTSTSGDVTDGIVTHTFVASDGSWEEGHVYQGSTRLETFSLDAPSVSLTVAAVPGQSQMFEFRFSGFEEIELPCGTYTYTAPTNEVTSEPAPEDVVIPGDTVTTPDAAFTDMPAETTADTTTDTEGAPNDTNDTTDAMPTEPDSSFGSSEVVAPLPARETLGQPIVDGTAEQVSEPRPDLFYAQGGAAGCSLVLR